MAQWSIDTALVDDWLDSLDRESFERVIAALELLAQNGPHLGRPIVDSVVGSRYKNMKELRPGSSGRSELRALFAFDPERRAILLVAGDKSEAWRRWYVQNIPLADERFARHLDRLRKERR